MRNVWRGRWEPSDSWGSVAIDWSSKVADCIPEDSVIDCHRNWIFPSGACSSRCLTTRESGYHIIQWQSCHLAGILRIGFFIKWEKPEIGAGDLKKRRTWWSLSDFDGINYGQFKFPSMSYLVNVWMFMSELPVSYGYFLFWIMLFASSSYELSLNYIDPHVSLWSYDSK